MSSPSSPSRTLTAREAAARLGIKVESLYAYVSRGMLVSTPAPGGKGSRFDPVEVERLAGRKRGNRRAGSLEVVIGTRLTLMEQDALYFRGANAATLARTRSFESVAEWLWGDPTTDGIPPEVWTPDPVALEAARKVQLALPDAAPPTDRMRAMAAVAGSSDPLRYELAPNAIARTGRSLIACLVDGLPMLGGKIQAPLAIAEDPRRSPIAARLLPRLTAEPPCNGFVELLNAALVLGSDHELAASTMATRVAASVRCDPYSIVSTGLGVLAGPLHGAASGLVHRLLKEVGEPQRAIPVLAEHFRRERFMPGFGHVFYRGEDPRASVLLAMLRDSDAIPERLATIEAVQEALRGKLSVGANVDFALASFAFAAGMCDGAGEAIFAVARTAGWLAHAIEEFEERPLRFRSRAHYLGPAPGEQP